MPLKFLEELKKLNFAKDKFAVFGSGCLAVRNLRENNDIDLIVKDDLWEELAKQFPVEEKRLIRLGEIEVWKNLNYFEDKTFGAERMRAGKAR